MKKTIYYIAGFLFCYAYLAFGQSAADTVVILGGSSNAGSIENTINGDTLAGGVRKDPNRVYVLKAGTIYTRNAAILFGSDNDTTSTLTILGQTGGTLPVILSNPAGGANQFTDNIAGNFTIKNVYWPASSISGSKADLFGIHRAHRRLIMQNVVTEYGGNNLFTFSDPGAEIYLYNCYFRDMNWFENSWNSCIVINGGMDTCWVENCTMTHTGLGFFLLNTVRFAYFNHNTFVNATKYGITKAQYQYAFFTNNIFVNMDWEGECSGTFYTQDDAHVFNGVTDIDTVRPTQWQTEQGYVPDPTHRAFITSNNIHYTDTCLNAYYRGEYSVGFTHPVSSRNWAPWAVDSTAGNIVVQDIPPIFIASYTVTQAKLYPNIIIDSATIHEGVDPKMHTETVLGWMGDGVRNKTALTQLAYFSEANYGVAPSGQVYDPTKFTFGDYDPTTVPGVKTENGAGFTTIRDLTEDFSYDANITSTIDGKKLGALGWWANGLDGWNSIAEEQAVLKYYNAFPHAWQVATSVREANDNLPSNFALAQNYPNPFNPTTMIEYSVPRNSSVTLKVYNVLGQVVSTLFSGVQHAGNYTATFDGSRLSSGIYFYRLEANGVSITKKLMLLK